MIRFCGICGFKIEGEDEKFCPNCGAKLGEAPSTNPAPAARQPVKDKTGGDREKKKRSVFLLAAAAVAVIGIIIIAMACFSAKKAKTSAKGADADKNNFGISLKKAKDFTDVVKAYNDTINADNFRMSLIVYGEDGGHMEVYGKGETAEDIILTWFVSNEDEHEWDGSRYLFEEPSGTYVEVMDGNYFYHTNGQSVEREDGEDENGYVLVRTFCRAIAKRDISTAYDILFGGHSLMEGFTYDEIYQLFFDEAFGYINNRDDKILESVSVDHGKYSITAKFLPLCQALEKQRKDGRDLAEAFTTGLVFEAEDIEYLEENIQDLRIRVDMETEGKYIKYISIYMPELEEDRPVLYLGFDDVNSISEEDSIGCRIIKQYQKEQ